MSLQENIRYVREKRVAALLNEMVLHILARNPEDPLDDLIRFLEKQLPADHHALPKKHSKIATAAVPAPANAPVVVATQPQSSSRKGEGGGGGGGGGSRGQAASPPRASPRSSANTTVVSETTLQARSDPVKAHHQAPQHGMVTLTEIEARRLVAQMLVNESLLQADALANGRTRTKNAELVAAWDRLERSIPAALPAKEGPLVQMFATAEDLLCSEIVFRSKLKDIERGPHPDTHQQPPPLDAWARECLERAAQLSDSKVELLARLEEQSTAVLRHRCKGGARKTLEACIGEHGAAIRQLLPLPRPTPTTATATAMTSGGETGGVPPTTNTTNNTNTHTAPSPSSSVTPTVDSITERFLHNEHEFRLLLSDLKAKTPRSSTQSRAAIDAALKNSQSVGDAIQEVALGCWYLQRAPNSAAAAELLSETRGKLTSVENEIMKAHLRLDRSRKLAKTDVSVTEHLPSEALRTAEGKRALGLSKNIQDLMQTVERNQQLLARYCPLP